MEELVCGRGKSQEIGDKQDSRSREHVQDKALRRFVKKAPNALYRGWMLSPEKYASLHAALGARGVTLVNTPEQYRHCHYFPDSYSVIEAATPKSVWLAPGVVDIDSIMTAIAPLGDAPLVLKDYVKSRKHEWLDACFIPSARDRSEVSRVVKRFLELQGDDLAGGLVFRQFVEFRKLTTHSKSGMPLSREFRLFVLGGDLIAAAPYWEEGEYSSQPPPLDRFRETARFVRSRFFTMDIAERSDGEWLVVELGDAGLPERLDPADFYSLLASRWGGG